MTTTAENTTTDTEALTELLAASVKIATGIEAAEPRPGQLACSLDIWAALNSRGRMNGIAPTGTGKALDIHTPIPTPNGWKAMGDLVAGDELFDEDGNVCRVTQAFDFLDDRECYEIVFSDGSKIVADLDHLWRTSTALSRASRSASTKPSRLAQKKRVADRAQEIADRAHTSISEGEAVSMRQLAIIAGVDYGTLRSFAAREGYLREDQGRKRQKINGRSLLCAYAEYLQHECNSQEKQELWSVRTTSEIISTLRTEGDGRANHAVPSVQPLALGDTDLPMDPYTLGVWLGDGCATNGVITSNDLGIVEEIVKAGFPIVSDRELPGTTARVYRFKGLVSSLREAGFVRLGLGRAGKESSTLSRVAKFIPGEYLRASTAQRLALLQGIMDADGTVDARNGQLSVDLCDPTLAKGVAELIRTLGIRLSVREKTATITEKDESGNRSRRVTGSRWRMTFSSDMPIFRLSRKLELQRPEPRSAKYRSLRYIVDAQPVASRTVRCIAVDSPNHVFLAGEGFVPTHNSFAHMTCAALAAVLKEERSVISTNSLALQAQFMDKDLPVVAEAVAKLYDGFELRYAVLKGVSNYIDPVRVLDLAQSLTGKTRERSFVGLLRLLKDGGYDKKWAPKGPQQVSPAAVIAEMTIWALESYLDDHAFGDRESCPVEHTGDDWALFSASSDEKADEKDTGYMAKADVAKDRALEAHIVVTNHTLLGMQAAQRIPVVFGSKRLGRFDHIIVDEAHTLPEQVRSRGAAEVSGRAILRAARAVSNVIEDRYLEEDAQMLAKQVDEAMKRAVASLPPRETALRVGSDDPGPVEEVLDSILQFTGGHLKALKRIQDQQSSNPVMVQKCRRATSALERLSTAADAATEANPHIARWVTKQHDPKHAPVFESSPIYVGNLIENELWTVAPIVDMDELQPEDDLETLLSMREPLGVACISATLPSSFHVDVRIPDRAGEYESPFGVAYAGSAMFVPQCLAPGDVSALQSKFGGYGGKPKFDTYRHEDWAMQLIVELVRANGGRALVLSAKADSGKKYGAALQKALPELNILTQWDGGQVSRIIDRWRSEETSVLVGTKSCMTGIDAKGETASLIIIDRPPRAAKNVIDEARLEDKMSSLGGNRWAADQQVYVSDAALLLDQAIGRAIRAESDRAMVAVLDPRLLTAEWSTYNYSTQARHEYVKPLLKFGNRFNDLGAATQWIRDRRAEVDTQ